MLYGFSMVVELYGHDSLISSLQSLTSISSVKYVACSQGNYILFIGEAMENQQLKGHNFEV